MRKLLLAALLLLPFLFSVAADASGCPSGSCDTPYQERR